MRLNLIAPGEVAVTDGLPSAGLALLTGGLSSAILKLVQVGLGLGEVVEDLLLDPEDLQLLVAGGSLAVAVESRAAPSDCRSASLSALTFPPSSRTAGQRRTA